MLTKFIAPKFRNTVRLLTKTTSIDDLELQHFKQFTEEWWNETGYMRALHSMNKLRIPFIRDGILNLRVESQTEISDSRPLKAVSILDVGCGGGILTEPLARLGGDVTGLDPNADIIEKAKLRVKNEHFKLEYICSSLEEYSVDNTDKFDAVVASEILEHVSEKEKFLSACVACLKPGGSIFVTTINKTCPANLLGVILAENVFQLLPSGTHQYSKFIEPHKLQGILEDLNCRTVLTHGLFYNFAQNEWIWCRSTAINYALHAIKLKR